MKNSNRYGRPQPDTNNYYDNYRRMQFDDRYNDYGERNYNENFNSYQDTNNSGRDFNERQHRQENDYTEPGFVEYTNGSGRNQGGIYSPDRNLRDDNWNRSNSGNNYYNRQLRGWLNRNRDEVSPSFGDNEGERRQRMDEMRDNNRGKGPKNYKRSSERIKEDVNDKLSDDRVLDASDIEVEVKGSEIILNGTVDGKDAKRRAEDIADSISGVTNVQNNLRVNTTSETKNKNAGIGSTTSTHSNGDRKKESMSHN